jgi:hypothetical protein
MAATGRSVVTLDDIEASLDNAGTTATSATSATSATTTAPAQSAATQKARKVCPEQASGWLAFVSYSWMYDLLVRGHRASLNPEDLWQLDPRESANSLHLGYEAQSASTRSMYRSLWRLNKRTLLTSAACMGVFSLSQLATPLIVRELVTSVQDKSFAGLYYSLALFGVQYLGPLFNQMHLHLAFRSGLRVRATIITEVYRKAMEMSSADKASTSIGQITNLVANDSQKVYEILQLINLLWCAPAQVIVSAYFLIQLLGVSALPGIAVLILCVPFSKRIAMKLGQYRKKHMPVLDVRVRLCTEVLQNIKVCKFFCWEQRYAAKILELRKQEEHFIRKELSCWAGTVCMNIVAPVIAMVLTFTTYSHLGNTLRAPDVFAALLFFNILKASAGASACASPTTNRYCPLSPHLLPTGSSPSIIWARSSHQSPRRRSRCSASTGSCRRRSQQATCAPRAPSACASTAAASSLARRPTVSSYLTLPSRSSLVSC